MKRLIYKAQNASSQPSEWVATSEYEPIITPTPKYNIDYEYAPAFNDNVRYQVPYDWNTYFANRFGGQVSNAMGKVAPYVGAALAAPAAIAAAPEALPYLYGKGVSLFANPITRRLIKDMSIGTLGAKAFDSASEAATGKTIGQRVGNWLSENRVTPWSQETNELVGDMFNPGWYTAEYTKPVSALASYMERKVAPYQLYSHVANTKPNLSTRMYVADPGEGNIQLYNRAGQPIGYADYWRYPLKGTFTESYPNETDMGNYITTVRNTTPRIWTDVSAPYDYHSYRNMEKGVSRDLYKALAEEGRPDNIPVVSGENLLSPDKTHAATKGLEASKIGESLDGDIIAIRGGNGESIPVKLTDGNAQHYIEYNKQPDVVYDEVSGDFVPVEKEPTWRDPVPEKSISFEDALNMRYNMNNGDIRFSAGSKALFTPEDFDKFDTDLYKTIDFSKGTQLDSDKLLAEHPEAKSLENTLNDLIAKAIYQQKHIGNADPEILNQIKEYRQALNQLKDEYTFNIAERQFKKHRNLAEVYSEPTFKSKDPEVIRDDIVHWGDLYGDQTHQALANWMTLRMKESNSESSDIMHNGQRATDFIRNTPNIPAKIVTTDKEAPNIGGWFNQNTGSFIRYHRDYAKRPLSLYTHESISHPTDDVIEKADPKMFKLYNDTAEMVQDLPDITEASDKGYELRATIWQVLDDMLRIFKYPTSGNRLSKQEMDVTRSIIDNLTDDELAGWLQQNAYGADYARAMKDPEFMKNHPEFINNIRQLLKHGSMYLGGAMLLNNIDTTKAEH